MISETEFRSAMSRFASGVTVVTTRDRSGRPHGITVSAFCSVSADPPLVLACIHKETASHYAFIERQEFVVNILAEHQQDISRRFAEPALDKFEGTEISDSGNGLPVIENSLVSMECSVAATHDGGDHTIIVGIVEKVRITNERPLIYFRGDYRQIGVIKGHDEDLLN